MSRGLFFTGMGVGRGDNWFFRTPKKRKKNLANSEHNRSKREHNYWLQVNRTGTEYRVEKRYKNLVHGNRIGAQGNIIPSQEKEREKTELEEFE